MGIAVEFLPVGDSHGDAIVVQYGEENTFYLHVVDGGYSEIGEQAIAHIEQYYGRAAVIEHMVVSHADKDHVAGLIPILKRFRVFNLWMNRPWLYASEVIHLFHGNWTLQGWINHVRTNRPYLVELEEVCRSVQKMEPREVFQGAQVGCFTVLAPSRQRYVSLTPHLDETPPPYRSEARRLFAATILGIVSNVKESINIETLEANPPATSASNETSVVQLGIYNDRKILLTADVGPQGLMEAAQYAYSRGLLSPPDLVQIPHQGSRRNVTPAALNAWLGPPNGGNPRRGIAMVAVGAEKDGHPRKKVKNAFLRRGYPVFVGREGWIRMPYGGYPSRGATLTPEPFSTDVEED